MKGAQNPQTEGSRSGYHPCASPLSNVALSHASRLAVRCCVSTQVGRRCIGKPQVSEARSRLYLIALGGLKTALSLRKSISCSAQMLSQ